MEERTRFVIADDFASAMAESLGIRTAGLSINGQNA
jgi:hypothetical protein